MKPVGTATRLEPLCPTVVIVTFHTQRVGAIRDCCCQPCVTCQVTLLPGRSRTFDWHNNIESRGPNEGSSVPCVTCLATLLLGRSRTFSWQPLRPARPCARGDRLYGRARRWGWGQKGHRPPGTGDTAPVSIHHGALPR